MKKVTSLCSTILQPFQFQPEHRKTCGNESHEKEAKPIDASAPYSLHIGIGSHDKSPREASRHVALMDICPTFSHTC